MKKVLASIILVCYLAVSCGVVINFHYCMNRLASIEFFATGSKTYGNCGMYSKKSQGCCRDEIIIIKMQEDQQKAQVIHPLQAPDVKSNIPSAFIVIPFYNVDELSHRSDHSPPLLTGQDNYLKNCVFRI